jgi:hypothetical protein
MVKKEARVPQARVKERIGKMEEARKDDEQEKRTSTCARNG